MLVLSRKQGQRIVIGHDIMITVLETRGNRVRFGIIAPTGMPIHREEVLDRIARASSGDPTDAYRESSPFVVECG
jgi:carbon storage regulator